MGWRDGRATGAVDRPVVAGLRCASRGQGAIYIFSTTRMRRMCTGRPGSPGVSSPSRPFTRPHTCSGRSGIFASTEPCWRDRARRCYMSLRMPKIEPGSFGLGGRRRGTGGASLIDLPRIEGQIQGAEQMPLEAGAARRVNFDGTQPLPSASLRFTSSCKCADTHRAGPGDWRVAGICWPGSLFFFNVSGT